MKKNSFLVLAILFTVNAVIQGLLLHSPWFGALMAAMAVLMFMMHLRHAKRIKEQQMRSFD